MADRFNPRGAPVPQSDYYDDWELTNRPAMLPFLAEYTNAQTGERSGGFAVPSMVTEPVNALAELFATPAGTMPNPQNADQQRNALVALTSLYGGNALSGMARGAAPRAAQMLSDTSKPNPILFDYRLSDPRGFPQSPKEIVWEDDAGNKYAADGSIVSKGVAPGSMTWGETALSTATAPAKLATGLASTLSPYGSEGWQVPPIISEPVAAGNRLLNSGGFPNPQDPQNQQDAVTSLLAFFGANAFNPAQLTSVAARFLPQTEDAIARNYRTLAASRPVENFGNYKISRTPTSQNGGIKYELLDGGKSVGNLLIDAPRHLTPPAYEAFSGNTEKLLRRQPIAGTVTRIEIDEALRGQGLGTSLLDFAERDLKEAGAMLHPGDTNMTPAFITMFSKRNPAALKDSFERQGISKFDDKNTIMRRALRNVESGVSTRGVLTDILSDTRPSLLGSAIGAEQARGPGITAYHGSPHDFDKFDISKIGTGEGAQAYGHGLYFAESEGVAKTYRNALSSQPFPDAAGEGSRNYVVFDDSIIDILKKYGLLPAAYGLSQDDGYTTY